MGKFKVFIINGFGGSGKSTLENMILMNSKTKGHITSMVEIVKHYAKIMGWEGTKEEKDRRFLSDLKDSLSRWADIPMVYVYKKLLSLKHIGSGYCFVDAREKEDIKRLKKICRDNDWDCRVILVDRGIEKEFGNHADNNVMECSYDTIIANYGTLEDLNKCALAFIKEEDI